MILKKLLKGQGKTFKGGKCFYLIDAPEEQIDKIRSILDKNKAFCFNRRLWRCRGPTCSIRRLIYNVCLQEEFTGDLLTEYTRNLTVADGDQLTMEKILWIRQRLITVDGSELSYYLTNAQR